MQVLKKNLIIAIDGHSSCGKSTVAKDIAKLLSIAYVDTGAMYRAVTLYAMEKGLISGETIDKKALIEALPDIQITFEFNSQTKTNETFLNSICVEDRIRGLEVSSKVSAISSIGEIRKQLVAWQQQMGANTSIVMDGRDIGTVVFPNADLKIYMTASAEIRAQRRYDELVAKSEVVDFKEILENVRQRDFLDSTREESPLMQAEDALILDNSYMTREDQLQWIINHLNERGLISQ